MININCLINAKALLFNSGIFLSNLDVFSSFLPSFPHFLPSFLGSFLPFFLLPSFPFFLLSLPFLFLLLFLLNFLARTSSTMWNSSKVVILTLFLILVELISSTRSFQFFGGISFQEFFCEYTFQKSCWESSLMFLVFCFYHEGILDFIKCLFYINSDGNVILFFTFCYCTILQSLTFLCWITFVFLG